VWRPLQARGNDRGGFYLRALARWRRDTAWPTRSRNSTGCGAARARASDTNKGLGGYVQPLQEGARRGLRARLLRLMARTCS
jgi:hypothetical protein